MAKTITFEIKEILCPENEIYNLSSYDGDGYYLVTTEMKNVYFVQVKGFSLSTLLVKDNDYKIDNEKPEPQKPNQSSMITFEEHLKAMLLLNSTSDYLEFTKREN